MGVVLVMLLVATAVAACGDAGGDGDGGTVATTQTQSAASRVSEDVGDAALAKRALVRRSDLPKEWRVDGGTVTRLRCGDFQPFGGASLLVRSKRFTHEHLGVQERVALYATAEAARDALRRLDSRTGVDCLRRELRRHVREEAGGPARPARMVRVDRLGPTATARRYISSAISSYGLVIGYIDAVHVRVGRALAALVLVSGPTPPEEALYEHVVQLAPKRLETVLG